MSATRVIRKLDDLLDRQAACLKAGDIKGAFAIGPAIEMLVDRLEAEPKPVPAVTRLQHRANRNAGLIQAARGGVEAAREILNKSNSTEGFRPTTPRVARPASAWRDRNSLFRPFQVKIAKSRGEFQLHRQAPLRSRSDL